MEKILLTTKLTIGDYLKVNLHILYRKLAIKFMTGLGAYMLILTLYSLISSEGILWFPLIFGLFLTAGLPLQVYFLSKRNFKSNRRIGETINYEFDKDFIQLTGESFNTKFTWSKVYCVSENKDWILIWENTLIAHVVPKRDFNVSEFKLFKDIVNSHKGLKNKLNR